MEIPPTSTPEFEFNQEDILNFFMLGRAAALQAGWDLQRTVNVNMFNWWWEEGGGAIGRIVLEEFEMY